MRSLNVGVSGELHGYARAIVHRLQRLGFRAGVIDASERGSADVVVFISCEGYPDSLKNLSAYSYGYGRYGHKYGLAVTPVLLVRYGHAFYLRGSLAGDCSDEELVHALKEAYAMVPRGDTVVFS